MFEAHFSTAAHHAVLPNNSRHNRVVLQPNTCCVFNTRYQCQTWVWSAIGKRKDSANHLQDTLFLYIEYRAKNDIAAYLKQEITMNSLSQAFCLIAHCEHLELPDISPEHTTAWLTMSKS